MAVADAMVSSQSCLNNGANSERIADGDGLPMHSTKAENGNLRREYHAKDAVDTSFSQSRNCQGCRANFRTA